MSEARTNDANEGVAIIGMAGRFPRAANVSEFWRNIRDGVECISHFEVADLEVPHAAERARNPDYVRARSTIEGADLFDADFFGILPKEAELIDPQQRIFLECCWEALEDAGYDPLAYPGSIAVYAGSSANTYFLRNLCVDRGFIDEYTSAYQVGHYPTLLGTNPDFLATRVSYKLNLKGPSFTIQCGCSTSLVAVTQACQSLLGYQSDMALAGGVSITFPQKRGYLYQEGGMVSPDGHCRTFDADARGTVFGSGSAVVLLKRLEDAVADRDHIHAIIRGFAVNNDGSAKVGYTAPGSDGQAQVIAMAHAVAGVEPDSISYVEAHGTATPLGDPIEFNALTRAFRARTGAKGFCALGTAKMNVGHLDVAAGVTGLINAVQALVHKQLPPSIHFKTPNSQIDMAESPFYVNTHLSPWNRGETPRRAGVSAFGVGGTNAHLVVEEAPPEKPPEKQPAGHLLILSAKTGTALDKATENLATHLKSHPNIDLGAVAHTLQAGRRAFGHRRTLVSADIDDAIVSLASQDRKRLVSRVHEGHAAPVVFMFPGQGSQYVNMAKGLYRTEREFREDVDRCSIILKPLLGLDLRESLYPEQGEADAPPFGLKETRLAQPALFVGEYALARLWMRWGIRPDAMIGHSVGEFVAACLSGVLSLEDALAVIAERCRLMQQLPPGAMLSVRLSEGDVAPFLNGELSLAAENSPRLSVLSGPVAAINRLQGEFDRLGVAARLLSTSHAFHSGMMDPIIEPFTNYLKRFRFNAPTIPYISCVSGTWITPGEATDPAYWARHFREPVRFSRGVESLRSIPSAIFLEVGPGDTLCTLARQHRDGPTRPVAIPSLPDPEDARSESLSILSAAGQLWLHGLTPNWSELHGPEARRCSLPTYPFERKRYWIDPPSPGASAGSAPLTTTHSEESMRVPSADRADRIIGELIEAFEGLSGLHLSGSDTTLTFLEMGFDSLFLTQVTQAIQARFKLKITFRQLLDRESSLDALAAYIDAKLPAEAIAAPPRPPLSLEGVLPARTPVNGQATVQEPVPSVSTGPGETSTIEVIVREQLQVMSSLMSKQLDVLRGSGTPSDPQPSSLLSASPPATRARAEHTTPALEFKPFGPYKPVRKGTVGELNERQARYLNALIERYTTRTARSKAFTQTHRPVLADPRVAAGFRSLWKEMVYPIVTERSRGSRLWDLDGNEYIDILNGFGPIMFGHAPEFVTEAIESQLKQGFEIGPQTPLAGRVAALVCELTGMERATFCNTGSEAVMAAIRVARTVTSRQKIVLFSGSYHGTFDEVLVKGIRKGDAFLSLPIAPGIPPEKVSNVTVLDYGAPEALDYIRAHAGELAAVLVEPVQSRHPANQPVKFLREVRRITSQSGTALIFDEVVTGFRVHPGGVQALFGIRADLATYGKVVGGGLPIGILAGRSQFMDALDGGHWQYGDDSFPETGVTFFAGTFVRHPLALAATHAVLTHLKEAGPALQKTLNEKTSGLVHALNVLLQERSVPTRVEHFGSIFYFSIPTDQRLGSLLYYHLKEKGVHLQEGFPCFLTTAHSDADIDHVIHAFRESIAEMQRGGALPEPARSNGALPKESRPTLASSGSKPLDDAPLTEAQMEIWLSARLSDEASCAYNESFTVHFRGILDETALRDAVQRLVDRHDALRSTFGSDRECMHILDQVLLDIPRIDLTSEEASKSEASLQRVIHDDSAKPFDLVKGPLVRASLIKIGSDHHALLFTAHHLVCDGWSSNILLDELSRLYAGKVAGQNGDLPAAMPFSTYARSQAEWVRSPERAALEALWVAQFETPVSPLDLPLDRPRGSLKSYRGATARRTIDAQKSQIIKRFGSRQGCTLFATLLTGFKVLLHRLSDQSDIIVGIPAAGQSSLDGATLVGHCVNFLPLRSSFEDDPAVGKVLTRVKGTLLDAYEHQNYTYGSLIRKLSLPRDPSRLPLVEVQFNLERVGTGVSFPGLEIEVDPAPKSFVNFDLFLNAVESDRGIVLDCDYNKDLFDRETVERWLKHFETILDGMVADPERPVSMLPWLTDTERQLLVVDWNNTRAEYPREKCIHHLIEEQSARTPKAVAAVFEERRLTYGELVRDATRLAQHLQELGVGPGKTVGICLDRSLEMLVGVLATLKAGGAFVPLEPDYPSERIEAVIQDSKPAVLLTQERVTSRLRLKETRVVLPDEVQAAIAHESPRGPDSRVTSTDLAYLIYTSGSTGRPKGVSIEHRSVVNLLLSMAREPGLTDWDTLLAVTTLTFDIAILELLLPLTVGARVVIASREVAGDGFKLLRQMTESRATVLQATPATWRLLLEAGWTGSPDLKALCGGETLSRDLAGELLKRTSSVWNMYGPTETTVWSATSPVKQASGPVPIGPPIANTEFYVLDRRGQPVPIGVPGELHIGGAGLARGYRNEPRLSAEKFIANPFGVDAGSRMYRTGDLVRYLPDGRIEFLGRMDSQVKVRGFRIETGEVEFVLGQHRDVRECVVVAREDRSGEKRLVAYLVMEQPGTSISDLRKFIASKLPGYMVPSVFVPLAALPHTSNGKIDQRRLPPPDLTNPKRDQDHVAAKDPREQRLASICAGVLSLDRVGVHDNLFDLGADSIHVFQIVARARDAGMVLTPMQVLAGRTVSAITADLDRSNDAVTDDPMPQLVPVSREEVRSRLSWLS